MLDSQKLVGSGTRATRAVAAPMPATQKEPGI